ncbi:tRNA threonylcarbamoyladenosine biosynthesis protein TsaE [Candidatus Phycosocius bacilliformis]|uniref:tRNA threonylcarbamoyladenosine biosynthesis protein TsaE n=1 Tax=Candidatus Phycosocius bacilliformis TaxID=1445552 RepID=A0A2P2E9U3_9PROT|nr:tRNA (adenosine(37)-N6)-threonylcarbamoyltransferase complex ATPase subunit type 1 TsaE [Candidatus Phycosocius bacilliformis]GBF57837.1 tRNA threonylcarbamoyladenosine biosynthesis protein TsaE [Candidatus Phycosocius bacilliformis]
MGELIKSIGLSHDGETRALGARLAKVLRPGDCLALRGDLGAGKTSLARGLIQSVMGADVEVPSPTFTLVQRYQPDPAIWPDIGEILHFDLYRLEAPDEVWELGWEELDETISLVEWPDKAGDLLPPMRLDIDITFIGDHRRAHLSAVPRSNWKSRLHDV